MNFFAAALTNKNQYRFKKRYWTTHRLVTLNYNGAYQSVASPAQKIFLTLWISPSEKVRIPAEIIYIFAHIQTNPFINQRLKYIHFDFCCYANGHVMRVYFLGRVFIGLT